MVVAGGDAATYSSVYKYSALLIAEKFRIPLDLSEWATSIFYQMQRGIELLVSLMSIMDRK